MSCEVKPIAKVPELKKVQEWLGFSQDESWLNAVYYSVSPANDVIVIAHGSKIAILNSNWQSTHQHSVFTVNWKGELDNPNDIITAVLCIPLTGSSTSTGVDWTCVAVGLSTGNVIFYSDFGTSLFSQKWHTEPVQYIKAQSGKKINEEIHIGYTSCVCIIQGSNFFPLLKNLKNKNVALSNNRIDSPQVTTEKVSYRKWDYKGKSAIINDSVVVGGQKSCAYDHLLEQSLEGGFYAKCRSAPPQNSLVVGVGVKPYIGFYYAKEGFVQADFGDLAKAVASKLMSSLPSWLTKSSTSQPAQEPTQTIPAEPMTCRFGLCDIQRQAYSVWLAPGNQLAAVSDNLSRVVLVDCQRAVAIRVWKGYRDAQCSFIKVNEKTSKSDRAERRKTLFLAIFSPRRSCLEIWALQHGPKVAAFSVNKNGQLIYNTHSLMGIRPGSKTKYSAPSCLFIDPSDDTIKEVTVPFHCALTDSNSKAAKDVHLLRRMKMFLRSDFHKDDVSEIEDITKSFQTNEIRLQCLEMLSQNKRLTPLIFKTVVDVLSEKIDPDEVVALKDLDSSDMDRRMLAMYLCNYRKLVNFYISIKRTIEDHSTDANDEKLSLSESDLETIQTLLDIFICEQQTNQKNRVTFQDGVVDDDLTEFLSVFNVETENIYLNSIKTDHFGLIGSKVFSRFLEKGHSATIFMESAKDSGIKSDDFMKLVLNYWLETPFIYTKSEEVIEDMTRLASVIFYICELAKNQIEYDYNSICLWWQEVREILLESQCALRGLLSAIVCRNLSNRFRKREGSCEDSSSDEDLWEQVSQEAAQWSLLIGKLEDISILGAVLGTPLVSTEPDLPTISYEKPESSLKSILNGGKGIVAELTGKWLSSSGINPKQILEKQLVEEVESAKDSISDPVCKYIYILRQHFPFSLESGILLCQMSWDYMCYWSKNLTNLQYLKAALVCLDAFLPEDFAFKHGLCCMIWNAHLKIPLEAIKKLINKAGRVPKEKFCLQDVGIPDSLFAELLDYCLQFFKHFSTSLEYGKRDLRFEEILQDGQIPLAHLTLQQNHAIPEILNLHIELCMVLHLIAVFSIKISKPIQSLFDAVSNQTFFVEINREIKYTLPPANMILRKHREEFLCQAVTCSLDLVREDLERLYIQEHTSYMERIKELASIWTLDVNVLHKHQIVEMYAHGWDSYAEELLELVTEQQELGPPLLDIACRRLNIYAGNSSKIWSTIAAVGALLTDYLDKLKTQTDGPNICQNTKDITLDGILGLAGKAFHILSQKDSKQLRIAGQLFDACHTIKELKLK